eukprot:CAMPEP_0206271024 /NCGR_PEP_ID=MMETSP0047_2-20121206/33196_1 /ASSEMBLY_ACC=CAM_ASM_000192 /TAXON_ID=195065 /ORGANISM="Chroomonas mesostigmatica_cf, Strain CCMP1168" /LENGTH=80 /DNA_ID=CAMNT_0053699735 /DNA_START=570 /DNA_END=808 /DNA_ORIENTATION=+
MRLREERALQPGELVEEDECNDPEHSDGPARHQHRARAPALPGGRLRVHQRPPEPLDVLLRPPPCAVRIHPDHSPPGESP